MRVHPSSLYLGNGRRIADVLCSRVYGASAVTLANELDLPKDKVLRSLHKMQAMGAVRRAESPDEEGVRWHITVQGQAALAAWAWLMEGAP